jgi:hypothetical protein
MPSRKGVHDEKRTNETHDVMRHLPVQKNSGGFSFVAYRKALDLAHRLLSRLETIPKGDSHP